MEAMGVTPLALQDRPVIPVYLSEFGRAFGLLNRSRQFGLTQGPIQLTEIHAYLAIYGVPPVGKDSFIDLILKMDDHYLEVISERRASRDSNRNK